ncbi:MAG TPA: M20/M25/M40 family metallo-hydrolase [Marmoricola sp.]|nr:M20/M25/M40 family metallo-hydrolase [Marmoricola sp.]
MTHAPAVDKLQALVRIQTVSWPDEGAVDRSAFEAFHGELARQFPRLHERLERHRVGAHGLLFRWAGAAASRPVVLMAHQDVVPVDASAPWQHPPFAAEVHEGAVWGRGTLDDKGALVAICEAVERLLEDGFVPAQDVWLSFGAREEVSGPDAQLAVEALRSYGVAPWLVLDEGGAVAHQAFPGIDPPLGVIGVCEKGTTTVELVAEGRGGHSSTPAPHGPTARIARAITRLERRQLRPRLPAPTLAMFERLAPYAPDRQARMFRNARRLRLALGRALIATGPEAAALARTTMTVTTLEGSPAHNVIASRAAAGVNLRIMVGDSVDSVVRHIRRAIRDRSIRLEVVDANEPSPVSPSTGPAYELVARTIEEVFPDAVVTPYVVMAATDARFFAQVCPHVYRFAPFRMTKEQRESIHSYDEHLGVEDFLAGIEWYQRLLRALA